MSKRKSGPKTPIKSGFEDGLITLAIADIIPLKAIPATIASSSSKFQQILASVRHVGIIEPPVVAHDRQNPKRFILLDGHLRIEALKQLGAREVKCQVSRDDESYTYNKHVNRLSIIQEHNMILRAIKRGVPENKLAEALNVNIDNIRKKRNLLEGICREAVELLKEEMVAAGVFSLLRRMKPMRQIECATLMNDTGIYTVSYAEALFAGTAPDDLVDPSKPKKIKGLDAEQLARMENEMSNVQREYKLLAENIGPDIVKLTLAKSYVTGLLGNVRVVRYLAQSHPAFLTEFQKIAEMKSLAVKSASA